MAASNVQSGTESKMQLGSTNDSDTLRLHMATCALLDALIAQDKAMGKDSLAYAFGLLDDDELSGLGK